MGEVYLGRDPRLDRLVAIKLLRADFDDPELRSRFEEEAKHAAKLTHPNIVTIYEYGEHDGRPFIAMEYIPGHSLAEIIREQHPVALARRLRYVEELCAGLAHAHKAHIVHRDVKPANLMVTTAGTLKVLDFGIAKLHGSQRTQKGMLVGTVNYMSPEQVNGLTVDHRSDIFAVGAVLYELLTYEQAFKGDLTAAMYAIAHKEPEPLVHRCPGLDPALADIVGRCLAKDPARRYPELASLKRDLARVRRTLDEDEVDAPETLAPLADVEKTLVIRRGAPPGAPGPATDSARQGPETRRALATALAEGEAALGRGQFESAIRHAEQALTLDTGNVSARDLLERSNESRRAAEVAGLVARAREALVRDDLATARTVLNDGRSRFAGSDTLRRVADEVEARAAELRRLEQALGEAEQVLARKDFSQARQLADTAMRIRPNDSGLRRLRERIEREEGAHRAWVRHELDAVDTLVAKSSWDEARTRLEQVRTAAPTAEGLSEQLTRIERGQEAARLAERDAAAATAAGHLEAGRFEAAISALEGLTPPATDPALVDLLARAREGLARAREEDARRRAEEAQRREEEARQRALDGKLDEAERLVAQARFERGAMLAIEVLAERPDDERAAALRRASEEGQSLHLAATAAIESADEQARLGDWEQAIAVLTPYVDRHAGAADALVRVRRGQARAERREQRLAAMAAWRDRAIGVATDRRVVGGAAALVLVSAVGLWLWSGGVSGLGTPSPESTVATADPSPPPSDPTGATTGVSAATSAPAAGTAGPSAAPNRPSPEPSGEPSGSPGARPPATSASTTRPPARSAADQTRPDPSSTRGSSARDPAPPPTTPPRSSGTETSPGRSPTATPRDTAPVDRPPAATRAEPTRAEERPAENTSRPARPATTPPADEPAEPAPAPESVQRQADETAIRGVLMAFGSAYESQNVGQMQALWPSMSDNVANVYRRAFQGVRSVGWAYENMDIRIDEQKGVVMCRVLVTRVELRSRDPQTESRPYRFSLQKGTNGRWQLTNVEFLGGGR
jgi:serine/threonine-protein kinase